MMKNTYYLLVNAVSKAFCTPLIVIFFLFCSLFTNLSAQKTQPLVFFKNGVRQLSQSIEDLMVQPINVENGGINYRWIQFDDPLQASEKAELINSGIRLFDYIGNNCYLVAVPPDFPVNKLKGVGGIATDIILPEDKMSGGVLSENVPEYAERGNQIAFKIQLLPSQKPTNFVAVLQELDITEIQETSDPAFIYLTCTLQNIDRLLALPWVRFVEYTDPPVAGLSFKAENVHRSNILKNNLPNGIRYDGSGIKILVRDDGPVGPHIDFQGRLKNITTINRFNSNGTHADVVSGSFASAGNLDPEAESGASGSEIYVINYDVSYLDNTLSLHQDSGIVITNNSFGGFCQNTYNTSAHTVDKQIYHNPTLMHVHSAGNDGVVNCGFVPGWGNIAGHDKNAKNSLVVGNVDFKDELSSSSSRGPVADGRIKPDIVGQGTSQLSTRQFHRYSNSSGTSISAPSVAGCLAQLYHAYKDLHNDTLPSSALIKAAILNSARDIGNPGPDFKHGWGIIHTARAYDILSNNQYFEGVIDQDETQTFNVSVPAGVGQLRTMVYWHDPEASLTAPKALVNNLDLIVITPMGDTIYPYILNTAAHADSLDKPAIRGIDALNNMEQVAIDLPASGSYAIQITGTEIPVGPQDFYLVYTFIEDGIKVTFPNGNEELEPGFYKFRWDAYGNGGQFDVEISYDNGSNWGNVGSVPGDQRYIQGVVGGATSQVLLRVSRDGKTDVSDSFATAVSIPPNLAIQTTAIGEATFSWNFVFGADKYYVYALGNQYMELVDSTTSTSYTFTNLTEGEANWYSVRAHTSNGYEGRLADAIPYLHAPSSSCGQCITSIDTFPYLEDFQSGQGLFCNFFGDDTDWHLDDGQALVAVVPHTTGPPAFSGNQYLFLESAFAIPSKTATIGGPCFDLTGLTEAYLQFSYSMYGSSMGSLNLEVSTDNGANWSAPIWSQSGDQGPGWYREYLDLSPYLDSIFTFRFIGMTGNGSFSDMALDNIGIVLQKDTCSTDYDALITFYDSTGGPDWTNKTGWEDGKAGTSCDPCSWYGVTCDADNRVGQLHLQDNNLSGTLPTEIEMLDHLNFLLLHNTVNNNSNEIGGALPTSIGNLTKLKILNLNWNDFTGSLPSEIGNLQNLAELRLKGSQLNGSLPATIGNLQNLTYLDLAANLFSGAIPSELGNLMSLDFLSLHANLFDNTIPASLGNLVNLSHLQLSSNNLSGAIPPELGNLQKVISLFLSGNDLSGNIPPELGNMQGVFYVGLSENQLTGNIPPEFKNIPSLSTFNVSFNQLTGSIPAELGTLDNLNALVLNDNQLSGQIPPELGNLANLTSLNLSNNQLSGNLPKELSKLEKLITLVTRNNQLCGCYPDELANLCNQLTTADIHADNEFIATWEDFCNLGVGSCEPITCPDSIYLSCPIIPAGTYQAVDSVSCVGTVISGDTVNVVASIYIDLLEGFEIELGSTFEGYIDVCPNNVGAPTSSQQSQKEEDVKIKAALKQDIWFLDKAHQSLKNE